MVATDIFPFATMIDGCKKVYFMELKKESHFLQKFSRSGFQNFIFMGKETNLIGFFQFIKKNS